MKKIFYVLFVTAALAGLNSCNSNKEEHTTETTTTTTTDSAAMDSSNHATTDTAAATGAAGTVAGAMMLDADFAKMAASGGILEVELGKVAAKQATDSDVKAFGQLMSSDHTKANANLKKVAAAKKMDLPTTMNAEHQATYDRISKLKGAEFDKTYMGDMVKDHQKDVSLFTMQAEKGTDAELKSFAQTTLPVLKTHLDKATTIANKVGASATADAAAHSAGHAGGH